ncbi:MAG: SAM-dependent methyltransferase [Deltaproteobacteria bacterium]|nr:SAM-dependent methyltransferase [Deltaproteobacteria bacterium]
MEQNHLPCHDRINLGSYYTKPAIVSLVLSLLHKNVGDIAAYALVDTSCGYGSFLATDFPCRKIGADIDKEALKVASAQVPAATLFYHNSLRHVSRRQYGLSAHDKIIIIGNPPYNDATSLVRRQLKRKAMEVDCELKTRDIGISFLRAFSKLQADYICILHPLSYLIKRANFALLKDFAQGYRLLAARVISSAEFAETSKATTFPIIAALYQRNAAGMDFAFIEGYPFITTEEKTFRLSDFDYVTGYLHKYPNQRHIRQSEAVAKFWTLRDINALRRSRTFVQKTTASTVLVTTQMLDYYCYVDVFKRHITHIPYYLGNCDIIIDNYAFLEIKDAFRFLSLQHNPQLGLEIGSGWDGDNSRKAVSSYMKNLLHEHYINGV